MQTLIDARKVSVFRDGQTILDKVSLSVGERDFITIIGPNGAGKSMLLKCLLGFYPPDQGAVSRRKALNIGYVPQSLVADYTMPITARRFLTLRKKVKPTAMRQSAEETGIDGILDRPLHVLSSGQLQRVLLTRALLDKPELLVLDEPAHYLDIVGQMEFYKLLEQIYRQSALSILIVSHDLHLVMSCTKQVVCLFHHVCCSGEPHIVAQDPEFTALFGNDMARLMAVYQHTHNHQHDTDGHSGHSHAG